MDLGGHKKIDGYVKGLKNLRDMSNGGLMANVNIVTSRILDNQVCTIHRLRSNMTI